MNSKPFGSTDLTLPEELRAPLQAHLRRLREAYVRRGWAGRVGFGKRPAVLVIDLAAFWLDPTGQIGSDLVAVVNATRQVLRKRPVTRRYLSSSPAMPTIRRIHRVRTIRS